MGYSIGIINHLVMTNIAMENPQNRWRFLAGKNGKSSISMGHGFHGYVKLPECKPSISDPWIFTYIHQMKICRKAGSLFFISDQSSRSIGLRQCPIVLWTTLSPLSWDRCMPVIRKMAVTPSYPSLQIWQVGLGHIITGVRQAVDWMGMKSQVERCVALKREREYRNISHWRASFSHYRVCLTIGYSMQQKPSTASKNHVLSGFSNDSR